MSKQDEKNNALLETPQVDDDGSVEGGTETEMDAATLSVSKALRTCFLALQFVLVLLVLLYLGSGYFTLPPGSQAVVVQFGRIKGLDSPAGPVLEPGPHWAWPWPVSQVIVEDVERPRPVGLTSFWFYIDPPLRGLSLDEMLKQAHPPDTLTPGMDGYLLSGEQEIVHVKLAIKYRIDKLVDYVTNVDGDADPLTHETGAQKLISRAAEWACTRTVANMRTDTVVRGEVDTFKGNVKRLMQKRLEDMGVGLSVVDIIVEDRTVPLQVRDNYLQVVQAENEKLKVVSSARTKSTEILNQVAGPSHEQLKQAIQGYELARAKGETQAADAQMNQILSLVDNAGGTVASMVGAAMAERSRSELAVRAEVRRFRDLYDKYQANPSIFISQLWADVRADILDSPELEVVYLPFSKEIRMTLDHNPQFLKAREARKYQQQAQGN